MNDREHWQDVYTRKAVDEVSWYQPHLARSLTLIDTLALGADAHVVDAGGGASTLVDDLLARGFHRVTVIDLAQAALDTIRVRLGDTASGVTLVAGDVIAEQVPDGSVDLWHDRAVFHFQTDPERRRAYVDRIAHSLRVGGHVILATFALDGPTRCSDLPVERYDAAGLLAALGPRFERVSDASESHATPRGGAQSFTYLLARRTR